MVPRNCLSETLDRLVTDGGYGAFRGSSHSSWGMPHVLHEAQDGTITHYVPPRDLDKPLQSLWGFDGEVRIGDNEVRGPMPLRGIVIGAWLLALGATGWALGRLWRRAWE